MQIEKSAVWEAGELAREPVSKEYYWKVREAA